MKKFIFIVISCFLLFFCSDVLQDLDKSKNFVKCEADYDREAFTQKQGPIVGSEIKINGEKIPYTSSSVIIPEGYHEDLTFVNDNHIYRDSNVSVSEDYQKNVHRFNGAFHLEEKFGFLLLK